jgi:hypothetical protein
MDDIDALFSDPPAPTYPGSRQVVKSHLTKKSGIKVMRAIELFDPDTWGKATIKQVGGRDVALYTIGALAKALDRPLVTIRMWESHGYIPIAPFHADHVPGKGGTTGRRYYPKEAIVAALEEFHSRGLLGTRRIEWSEFPDLPVALADRWRKIVLDFEAAR